MLAEIVTGERDAADVLFLIAIVLAVVAVVVTRLTPNDRSNTVYDALLAASFALVAWGLMLQ